MIQQRMGVLLVGIFLLALMGCSPKPEAADQKPPVDWAEYEGKLQRTLFDLVRDKTPGEYAKQRDLDYVAMVHVVIELAPAASLPEGFLILEEGRYEREVQAWVPADQLLELSQRPEVHYIRAPQKPKPY
jgi:hypothetical protein